MCICNVYFYMAPFHFIEMLGALYIIITPADLFNPEQS